jgi:hypothetical protein
MGAARPAWSAPICALSIELNCDGQPGHRAVPLLQLLTTVGTKEPCVSRSRAWPVLKEQETDDRASIPHRI